VTAPRSRSEGFTLAEVAVTIAVVGLALVWMLQALNTAKVTAAHTRNLKLARELALLTLGQIESGLYAEEMSGDRVEGTYAEEGYPDFLFEAIIGEGNFRPAVDDPTFDNWLEERRQAEMEDDEEEVEQPYEKVQVRVSFPPLQDLPSELLIERWLPWDQLHPSEDEDTDEGTAPGDQE
jgi:prepilin-type N-terminal cleavage/methylation domain-containing protein